MIQWGDFRKGPGLGNRAGGPEGKPTELSIYILDIQTQQPNRASVNQTCVRVKRDGTVQ